VDFRAPTIQVDGSFNPFRMIKSISITGSTKPESTASWESLYVGLKQEGILFLVLLISPLKEEVTGSLFNEEEVEQTVNNAYQIHKNIVSPIKSGMVIVDQQRAHQRVLYEQF
jgi:DNA mismatch repair protein MutL